MLLTLGTTPRINHISVSPVSGFPVRIRDSQLSYGAPPPPTEALSPERHLSHHDSTSFLGVATTTPPTTSILPKPPDLLNPETPESPEPPEPPDLASPPVPVTLKSTHSPRSIGGVLVLAVMAAVGHAVYSNDYLNPISHFGQLLCSRFSSASSPSIQASSVLCSSDTLPGTPTEVAADGASPPHRSSPPSLPISVPSQAMISLAEAPVPTPEPPDPTPEPPDQGLDGAPPSDTFLAARAIISPRPFFDNLLRSSHSKTKSHVGFSAQRKPPDLSPRSSHGSTAGHEICSGKESHLHHQKMLVSSVFPCPRFYGAPVSPDLNPPHDPLLWQWPGSSPVIPTSPELLL